MTVGSSSAPTAAAAAVAGPSDHGMTVVGVGASAGGLEACRRLLSSLPTGHGMAVVLVRPLDPPHDGPMAEQLAGHTTMTVAPATDGARLEPDHLYLIPPGVHPAVDYDTLRLTRPQARHGGRLPFDVFLESLARSRGPRAVAVVLSGTGADGSAGLAAVKAAGGFVVVQDPDEAAFDGMPRSAVATGAVDLVLPAERIGPALIDHLHRVDDAVPAADAAGGLDRLRGDPLERDRLAADLPIDVTGFFRDPEVFDHLAAKVVPDLVRGCGPERPLRVWVPGCGTGEEAYSLAMVFLEAIAASGRPIELRVFASDVDADAVATAREGLYPTAIEADVPAERLARFFTKEEHGRRVGPELRGVVVFTVRDVLSAPPFSRLDLVSCRNSSIRLGTEARERGLALLHCALRDDGVLLLGDAEEAGNIEVRFAIDVRPVHGEGEEMLLVCFVDEPSPAPREDAAPSEPESRRIAELEAELAATRRDLQRAILALDSSVEERKEVDEAAPSADEAFRSTDAELPTANEELRSLNEELTALNGRLRETMEHWRTTSSDLRNVLYSTDVAILFLDTALAVRFFTPATRALFDILPSDVGRPLADLRFLAADDALLGDAAAVMANATPVEREVEAANETWFVRRILPYRTLDGGIAGVVVTFVDVTERRQVARALDAAKRQAELASLAKSRFLAAANHDLRQPLQTSCLLQGLLVDGVEGDRAKRLVGRLGDALGAMTGMLDALLDTDQIEVGAVRPVIVDVAVADVLARMASEFAYSAEAKGLSLRVVASTAVVRSDRRLLEQMLRNLVANALKYTPQGRILVGCRRHGAMLRFEVRDTGIGIAAGDLQAIFEEYRQVDNAGRDRGRGQGLGLSIVRRLGVLLGHRVDVSSRPGRGSVFSIDVPRATDGRGHAPIEAPAVARPATAASGHRVGSILVVEDEPEVRDLLELLLERRGHRVAAVPDGAAAMRAVIEGPLRPDLLLADFDLPGGLTGLDVAVRLREATRLPIPAIILTGDVSTETPSGIAAQDCVHLGKPVKAQDLADVVERLLASPPGSVGARPAEPEAGAPGAVVHLVDDDANIREALSALLVAEGRTVEVFDSCEAFLAAYRPGREACLLIDAYLPGMSGLELLRRLNEEGHALPSIMITGNSDVAMAVQAMKAGATDFLEKPIARGDLLAGVDRALELSRDDGARAASREAAVRHVAGLTPRQIQIMEMVLAGHPSKNIAADLGISRRTVENHRAAIMKKTGSKSLPALARLVVAIDRG